MQCPVLFSCIRLANLLDAEVERELIETSIDFLSNNSEILDNTLTLGNLVFIIRDIFDPDKVYHQELVDCLLVELQGRNIGDISE